MNGWGLKVVEVVILVMLVFGFGVDMVDKFVIFVDNIVMVFLNLVSVM